MTVTDEIAGLHAEQQLLQLQIDTTRPCGHGLGSMAPLCKVCTWHRRCDEIDRALGRLLTHGSRA